MFYKVIYLNFWGELSTVYQEEKEDADYCAKLIKEAGLKVLGITKTKTKTTFAKTEKTDRNFSKGENYDNIHKERT